VADNPRLEQLRRRIRNDPASIAFAQLAEEHRRLGEFDEAVRISRAGLAQHPAYLSARVTLGCSLMELGRLDEAQAEFEHVLRGAPDNLVVLRSIAELRHRREAVPLHCVPPLPDVAIRPTYLAALENWLAAILADRASA
jgi:tetratricopeptide (TPR) repeat protein